MLIYAIVSCPQGQVASMCDYSEIVYFLMYMYFILYFQLFLLGKGKI